MVVINKLAVLFKKYMDGDSSPEETHEFMILANDPDNELAIKNLMDSYLNDTEFSHGMDTMQQGEILQQILHSSSTSEIDKDASNLNILIRKKLPLWKKITAVAAVITTLCTPLYLYINSCHYKQSIQHVHTPPSKKNGFSISHTTYVQKLQKLFICICFFVFADPQL